MTLSPYVPCEHCRKALSLHFDTVDGELVESVAPCDCEDARWRRGECATCGVKVPRTRPDRIGKKRCPKHDREYERERWRKVQRKRRERHGDRFNARRRERYRNDPELRRASIRRSREATRLGRRIRQRRAAERRAKLDRRNREITRRYEDGATGPELAEVYGLAASSIRAIASIERRKNQRQERAA